MLLSDKGTLVRTTCQGCYSKAAQRAAARNQTYDERIL